MEELATSFQFTLDKVNPKLTSLNEKVDAIEAHLVAPLPAEPNAGTEHILTLLTQVVERLVILETNTANIVSSKSELGY